MIILFFFFVLTKQQRDVEFDNNYFWTSNDKVSSNIVYRIKNLTQPYYYVQVTLFQEDLSFLLIYDLSQVPKLEKSKGDYISYYERRRTRFLKIQPNGQVVYISTYSNINQGNYNITIWGSENAYCDNSCSYNGKCTDDGCECYSGYISSDCHQTGLEIQNEEEQIYLFGDEIKFFYLNLKQYEQNNIQITLSTDSYEGLEIIMQLTQAIIIPSLIPLGNEELLIKQDKIYDSKSIDLILKSIGTYSDDSEVDFRLVFAARQINNRLNTEVSTLTINIQDYDYKENTVSIIVIIIIVVAISAAVIIIIILFFVCRSMRKRKFLRQQARIRLARMEAQSPNHNTQQQDQDNLFELLTPVQITNFTTQDNCAICLDNLNNNQEVRQTHCHHNFHSKCIKAWLSKNKKECPVCRSNLANKDIQIHQIPDK